MTNPFDLPGRPFLALYVSLLAATVLAGLLIPRWLRPEGTARVVGDPERLWRCWRAGGRGSPTRCSRGCWRRGR